MLFNSLEFAVFFPVVLALYAACPARWRWALLLVASYAFYMAWEPAYGLLLLFSTTVDWLVSRQLAKVDSARGRRALLATSLVVNLGLLFSFKYYNLVNTTFVGLAARAGFDWPLPESSLLLPVGISFDTFQTIGYTVDVWRGRQAPERHFGLFALYVSFFPQLVAGPIERAGRLLPQLRRPTLPARDVVASGLRLAASRTGWASWWTRSTRTRPSSAASRCSRRPCSSRFRSTATSRATRTSPSGWRGSWASI